MFSRSAENYPMCFQGIRNYTCLTTMLQTTHMLSNLLELHMFSHSAETLSYVLSEHLEVHMFSHNAFGITHV